MKNGCCRTSSTGPSCSSTARRPRPWTVWKKPGPKRRSRRSTRAWSGFAASSRRPQVEEPFEEDELVVQLRRLQEWLREHYDVGRTLAEQLADAVAHEQYEVAARLRDEIAKRSKR